MTKWLEEFCKSNELKCNPKGVLNVEVYENFSDQYKEISKELLTDMMTNYSSKIKVDNLDSFRSLLKEKSFQENKDEIIKILITKMLEGDMTSNAIFEAIYSAEGREELLLSYDHGKILNDVHLKSIYDSVAEENPLPITQAVYWLQSEEANNTSHDLVDWYHDCCSFEADAGA